MRVLACPRCGGGLSIRFHISTAEPPDGLTGYLRIQCLDDECDSTIYVRGGFERVPPWTESLGTEIVTSPPPGRSSSGPV